MNHIFINVAKYPSDTDLCLENTDLRENTFFCQWRLYLNQDFGDTVM